MEVPLRYLRPSIICPVPCDRIVQRAFWDNSGIPGLRTGSLNLIWSQWENFAFISLAALKTCLVYVCAQTKVGIVLEQARQIMLV